MEQIIFKKSQFLSHCDLDLTFLMSHKELNILVGPNGIGKTSFLKHLHQYLGESKSTILLQVHEPWFYTRKLKVIKSLMLDQISSEFNQETFDFLWKELGLAKLEDRTSEDLSGGEFQSLRLCLMLSRETDFYLLDEPSHYLDTHRKNILSQFLIGLIQRDKKIVVVEHDWSWIQFKLNLQELKLDGSVLKVGNQWNI